MWVLPCEGHILVGHLLILEEVVRLLMSCSLSLGPNEAEERAQGGFIPSLSLVGLRPGCTDVTPSFVCIKMTFRLLTLPARAIYRKL